jgi:hypothetical protein
VGGGLLASDSRRSCGYSSSREHISAPDPSGVQCVCVLVVFVWGCWGAMVCGGLPGGVLGWFEFVVGCCAAAKSIESSAAKEAYRRVLAASWKRLRAKR